MNRLPTSTFAFTAMPPRFIYLRPMRADDYHRVVAFWEQCHETIRHPADSFSGIATFLQRNPGLSVIVERGDELIGMALCSEDGRAGYIQHLVVAPECTDGKIEQAMLRRSLLHLRALGIGQCHLLTPHGSRFVELGRTAPVGLSESLATLAG